MPSWSCAWRPEDGYASLRSPRSCRRSGRSACHSRVEVFRRSSAFSSAPARSNACSRSTVGVPISRVGELKGWLPVAASPALITRFTASSSERLCSRLRSVEQSLDVRIERTVALMRASSHPPRRLRRRIGRRARLPRRALSRRAPRRALSRRAPRRARSLRGASILRRCRRPTRRGRRRRRVPVDRRAPARGASCGSRRRARSCGSARSAA
jgi:hypothetical protein